MHDDKRKLREHKRQIKKTGNRKRRRYLQQIDAEPTDFDFGEERSSVMNEPSTQPKRNKRPPHNDT